MTGSRSVGWAIIVVAVFAALAGEFWKTPQAPPPTAAEAAAIADEKAKRLAACEDSLAMASRTGFIRRQTDETLQVDERQWAQLPWDAKMILMDCVVVKKRGGGRPRDRDIVLVYGYRSGRKLAGGSPGAGTLAPE